MSYEKLQLNLLSFFEKGLLPDVTIIAQGREIRAHKVILAAQSEWFAQQFAGGGRSTIEVPQKYKVVKALIRFMYFGGVSAERDLGPDDGLDMMLLAEDFSISALDAADIAPLILPRLTMQNSLSVLQHEGLQRHPTLQAAVCGYVGENFSTMLQTMEDQLMQIPRNLLAYVLRSACKNVNNDQDAEKLVKFCLNHTQLESACDLLRETKQWNWGSDEASILRAPPKEEPYEGSEWLIENVRATMESTPARIVVGTYFDWCIRLDYGAEGKLRIVYESATPREDVGRPDARCINRFPAAMFAWRVLYRGQDVFNEKPVFICFPENVSLHWSTTLPVSAADLSEDDDLRIMVNMAENPMLSLVLYYFSADLKTTVFNEDILNRLPHIEYRCLSSCPPLACMHVAQKTNIF
jgi:hypothetical protein